MAVVEREKVKMNLFAKVQTWLLLISCVVIGHGCAHPKASVNPKAVPGSFHQSGTDSIMQSNQSTQGSPNVNEKSGASSNSSIEQGSPAWIVDQYLNGEVVSPELAKHFGTRLVILKSTPSLGMVAAQDSSLKFSARRFYKSGQRVAYQVGIGTQDQQLQAFWIFQKLGDLWIWTDLIQESPYYPWMKARTQIESSLSPSSGPLFRTTSDPSSRLYQVIQRGMGDYEVLSDYLTEKRKTFKFIQAKLAAEERSSVLVHNDSLERPRRWELWQHTGVYHWMQNESIERVQIESKDMVLFYFASQPKLEQGLIYCGNVDACKRLQPDMQGYYYIEYEKDPVNSELDWVHFRGSK